MGAGRASVWMVGLGDGAAPRRMTPAASWGGESGRVVPERRRASCYVRCLRVSHWGHPSFSAQPSPPTRSLPLADPFLSFTSSFARAAERLRTSLDANPPQNLSQSWAAEKSRSPPSPTTGTGASPSSSARTAFSRRLTSLGSSAPLTSPWSFSAGAKTSYSYRIVSLADMNLLYQVRESFSSEGHFATL